MLRWEHSVCLENEAIERLRCGRFLRPSSACLTSDHFLTADVHSTTATSEAMGSSTSINGSTCSSFSNRSSSSSSSSNGSGVGATDFVAKSPFIGSAPCSLAASRRPPDSHWSPSDLSERLICHMSTASEASSHPPTSPRHTSDRPSPEVHPTGHSTHSIQVGLAEVFRTTDAAPMPTSVGSGAGGKEASLALRRYICMALTNLTFGVPTNKAIVCRRRIHLEPLLAQLDTECEELVQVGGLCTTHIGSKSDGLQLVETISAL
ncbi:unnamed protein product [Protopolystoma xenopodis]|uniref:Uncharacterized protein n=1 Tax=Protopolystoma xenopodis TaxID=117903 RepID=A0A448XN20_9PLAT|nr:unnamed protein product [Protopolystoma xenopodis]